jgi:hypothetical protein
VRTAILAAGCLLVGLVIGLVGGLAVGSGGSEAAQSNPKTVTVERTVEVAQNTPSPSPSATASVTAGAASLLEEAANKECWVGRACDLGTGKVRITNVQQTDTLNTSLGETYSGNFVVVWFDYTYKGDSTADTGEAPWSLIDSDGKTYSMHFEATSSYGIDQDAGVAIYEQVQPGVPKPGVVVFEIAPGSEPSELIISDLVNVQGGDVARVAL